MIKTKKWNDDPQSEHFEWFHEKSALKQKIGANLAKQRLMILVRMLLDKIYTMVYHRIYYTFKQSLF